MKRVLLTIATSGLFFVGGLGVTVAQDDPSDDPAVPVELYACSYNEGHGPSDLDAVTASWNSWADTRGLNDYSAWTLTPFYYGEDQDFDVLWLGVSPSGQAMGAAQDDWVKNGGEIAAEFNQILTCNAHVNFAAVEYKTPPERSDPGNIILAFSDCNMEEGKTYGDLEPAIKGWADYRTSTGSDTGIWALFPAFGGGGEEFDFKWIQSYQNMTTQGVDYDEYSAGGWKKAQELFSGIVSCDSSRVYFAQNRRMAEDDEE